MAIVYPPPESAADARSEYFVKMLALALSKSGADFELQPYRQRMAKSRAIRQLQKGEGVDVIWAMTTRERERDLLPIRIPIDKGLLGWRLFLVGRRAPTGLDDVHKLDQLQEFSAGQGHDWPDTAILRANGLNVFAGSDYEGLFRMLQAGRFDYFPRSVAEIWDEQRRHAELGLEVQPTLVLHYPACIYFFVGKDNRRLAHLIETGLQAAIADGSFDRLFEQYNGEQIRRADLKRRIVLPLENPLLPEQTPLKKAELWFHR
ncbi:transporter substrate-binding domain-containing protein [Oxalobacteraceae bacterium OM1]|nr:transporter substrate-binding domain-containing protein [Oxalobacteraceae bacterium OM1]